MEFVHILLAVVRRRENAWERRIDGKLEGNREGEGGRYIQGK